MRVMAEQLPDRIVREIRERRDASAAAREEYRRLEAALAALDRDGSVRGGGTDRRPRRRARRASGRRRAAPGANRDAILAVVRERPGVSVGEIVQVTGHRRRRVGPGVSHARPERQRRRSAGAATIDRATADARPSASRGESFVGRPTGGERASPHFGRLVEDPAEGRVQCGLCGRWHRSLPPHLRQVHELGGDEYRRMFGLRAQRPLVSGAVSDALRVGFRRRLDAGERPLVEAMARAHDRARAGELAPLGLAALRELPPEGERRASRTASGRAVGLRRAERARAEREARARELGAAGLEEHLRRRYLADGRGVAEIAAELAVAESTVIADMDRFGIARRPQEDRLALGRTVLANGGASVAPASRRGRDSWGSPTCAPTWPIASHTGAGGSWTSPASSASR
jgi:ROS/MUCR transcriptional regulator protein